MEKYFLLGEIKNELEVGIKRLLGTLSMEYCILSSGSSGIICFYRNELGFPHSSVGKESTCSAEDLGLISGLGRSPGEGNGNLLHYSCLENPMDRGAWQATVHGVTRVRHN